MFLLFVTVSCASTLPNKDYTLAHSALLTAKQFSADKLATKYYSKGLILYKKAVAAYKQKDYEKASLFFEDSIKFSEKAELKARIKLKKEQNQE